MIIKKINFFVNKNIVKETIFNNLHPFDFVSYKNGEKNGEIAKFVLLIGENGSGKTSLLTLIANLFDNHKKNYKDYCNNNLNPKYDAKNYHCDDCPFAKTKIDFWDESVHFFFNYHTKNNEIFDINKSWSNCFVIHEDNAWKPLPPYVYFKVNGYSNDKLITKYWKDFYDHEINEQQKRNYYENLKLCYKNTNESFNFSENKNLNVMDNYKVWLKTKGIEMDDELIDFESNKKYCDFLLRGNYRNISQLPSGWKHQIILRSIASQHTEHIFLIDEPENSLYPHEQEELTNFLIKNSQDRAKKHQFFISTHSPFILKRFLKREDTVIINVENGENIKESKKLLLNGDNISSYDEIAYLYYGITTTSYYLSLFEKLKIVICEKNKKKEEIKKQIEEVLDRCFNINNKLIGESSNNLFVEDLVYFDNLHDDIRKKLENSNEKSIPKTQFFKEIILPFLKEQEDINKVITDDTKEDELLEIINKYFANNHTISKAKNPEIKNGEEGKLNNEEPKNIEEVKKEEEQNVEEKKKGDSEMSCAQIDDWLEKNDESIKKTILLRTCSRQTELVRLRHLLAHGGKGEKEYKYYVNNKKLFEKEEKTRRFYERYNNNFEELLRESVETIRKLIIKLENNLNS